jgi:hypothetical protein
MKTKRRTEPMSVSGTMLDGTGGHVTIIGRRAPIIGVVKQMENGRKAEDVAREIGVSKHNHLRLEAEVRRTCPISVQHHKRS